MILAEAWRLPAEFEGCPAGGLGVLAVSRQLRECDSVNAVMAAVTESAAAVTGCRQAWLIGVKPRSRMNMDSPEGQLALACVQAGTTVYAASHQDPEATMKALSPEWDGVLGSLRDVAIEAFEEADILLALNLPRGGGRHAAALVLGFDASVAPTPDLLTICHTLAELGDSAAAFRHSQDQVDSLLAALESSREIGTAMGILMTTRQINDDEAFAVLREVSQRTHRKVNAIAAEVVYTGGLPA